MSVRSPGSLVLVVAVLVAACVGEPGQPSAVPVPKGHPAADLTARSASVDEFSAAARLAGLPFTCGEGGGSRRWEVCMLRADGVVAVVGFGDSTGIVVKLTDMFHDEVPVPLEPGTIYGVAESEGRVHLLIESAGREIGELESEL